MTKLRRNKFASVRQTSVESHHAEIPEEKNEWHLLVARRGRYLAGSAILGSWNTPTPVIQSLYVLTKFRNRGVATEIIKSALYIARRGGKTAVTLVVAEKNTKAIELYRKLGFRTYFADDSKRWMSYPLVTGRENGAPKR